MRIEADKLAAKGFRGRNISDASFELDSGQCLLVSGDSGSGKSLLHGLLCGLVEMDSGKLRFDGLAMTEMNEQQDRDFRKKLGVVFQEPALISNLSISENLLLPLLQHFPELSWEQHFDRIEASCECFELVEYLDSRTDELSAGVRALVALTRGLITEPELLIWDAPMVNTDVRWNQYIKKTLLEMKSEGKTIILFSNSKAVTADIADLQLHLDSGVLKPGDELQLTGRHE